MSKSQNKTTRPALLPILMALAALIFITIFVIVALLLVPQKDLPTFDVYDQMGEWDAQGQGEIAVFDDTIKPGDKGTYDFIIRNVSDTELDYGFRLKEYLDLVPQDATPFMLYRIKMDGVYLGGNEWHYAGLDYYGMTIQPGSEHKMTLEWWWVFELDAEHNANDTLIGISGGELKVNIFIWAEINQ